MVGAKGVTRSQSAGLFSVCVPSPLMQFLPTYMLLSLALSPLLAALPYAWAPTPQALQWRLSEPC